MFPTRCSSTTSITRTSWSFPGPAAAWRVPPAWYARPTTSRHRRSRLHAGWNTPPSNMARCWLTPSWAGRTPKPGAPGRSGHATPAASRRRRANGKTRPAATSCSTHRSMRARTPDRLMPARRRIRMNLTLTINRRSTPSRATPQPHSNTSGARHGPWPAILEQLPEYEPDTLLLALEFYRESILRRLVDDQGHVTLALVDVAEVARALSAGVSLASGILPGDETGPNTLFWARSSGATRLGIWIGPRIWRLSLRSFEPGGRDRRLRLPFPGLLFVCRPDASGAYVFAAARRPRTLDDMLHL